VLLIAEAANPEWVSVPLVGWMQADALRRVADVHLVTQIRNADAIAATGLVPGRDFTVIDSEAVAARLHGLAKRIRGGGGVGWTTNTAMASLSYYRFEQLVWRRFGRAIRDGAYDLVHRLTPLSPTAPSTIAARCRRAGVPFIVGPLNGGLPWPREFDSARRREKEWLSYVRSAYRLLPAYRTTRTAAAAILVASRATYRQMPPAVRKKCVYIPENGIDPTRFSFRDRPPPSLPLRVAFVGRLVPYKGPDMLLQAVLPLCAGGGVHVEFFGDGPLLRELRERVVREGVQDAVTLHGFIDHRELQDRLGNCHVLAFPSIREFGGGVALEAMALGVVPIVPDYGGLGELVTPATGYLVPMADRAGIVAGFRAILARLATDPGELDGRARRAVARVRRLFTWDAKARQQLEVYRAVLGGLDLPRYPMPFPDVAPVELS
jgi:glycosyltransferase involved in cell wall biosynthesis